MENTSEYTLMQEIDENKRVLLREDKCDKYDYLVAVGCGAVGGLIDIFLVGTPKDSVLGSWTDTQVDNAVKSFAKLVGWKPKQAQSNNVASAIGFLERKYRVNYDQRYSSDVGNAFNMSTKNHHIMSLSHSPDILGLFFSILNQFTSTSSFIANGQLITIKTDTYELQGGNFIAKLFCGVANWLGHIMSDIAGSSGARGNAGRGAGVVMPFYELFQFCKFGKFNDGSGDVKDLAQIAIKAFEQGYDFRFGLAMAIHVVITDLSIRFIWSLRRHFQYNMPLKECIPSDKHSDLRIMLLLGNGTLCIMDGVDAAVRSGGNFLEFFMRLNVIGWFRFVTLVLKEVCIRVGLKDALSETLMAFKRINEALLIYLNELETIDIEAFRRETKQYNRVIKIFTTTNSDKELNAMLLYTFERMGIEKPWQGDFDTHMSNKNGTLVFK